MKRPEQQLQRTVAAYLRLMLPDDVFWSAFPAGGGGRIRGAQLKAMGLRPGVPDLMFIYCGRAYFIELKSDKGRLSKAQDEACFAIGKAGCPNVVVCKTLGDVIGTLKHWGIPLRLRTKRAA